MLWCAAVAPLLLLCVAVLLLPLLVLLVSAAAVLPACWLAGWSAGVAVPGAGWACAWPGCVVAALVSCFWSCPVLAWRCVCVAPACAVLWCAACRCCCCVCAVLCCAAVRCCVPLLLLFCCCCCCCCRCCCCWRRRRRRVVCRPTSSSDHSRHSMQGDVKWPKQEKPGNLKVSGA